MSTERPSRDILFLIKLEEPHSCFWVTAEPRGTRKQLWLYPLQARDNTCHVAGVLPASLWSIILFLFPSEWTTSERKDSRLNWLELWDQVRAGTIPRVKAQSSFWRKPDSLFPRDVGTSNRTSKAPDNWPRAKEVKQYRVVSRLQIQNSTLLTRILHTRKGWWRKAPRTLLGNTFKIVSMSVYLDWCKYFLV